MNVKVMDVKSKSLVEIFMKKEENYWKTLLLITKYFSLMKKAKKMILSCLNY